MIGQCIEQVVQLVGVVDDVQVFVYVCYGVVLCRYFVVVVGMFVWVLVWVYVVLWVEEDCQYCGVIYCYQFVVVCYVIVQYIVLLYEWQVVYCYVSGCVCYQCGEGMCIDQFVQGVFVCFDEVFGLIYIGVIQFWLISDVIIVFCMCRWFLVLLMVMQYGVFIIVLVVLMLWCSGRQWLNRLWLVNVIFVLLMMKCLFVLWIGFFCFQWLKQGSVFQFLVQIMWVFEQVFLMLWLIFSELLLVCVFLKLVCMQCLFSMQLGVGYSRVMFMFILVVISSVELVIVVFSGLG